MRTTTPNWCAVFSAAPAWVTSSGQIESGPVAFSDFRGSRAAANS